MKKYVFQVNFKPKKTTKQLLFERMNIIAGMPLQEIDWENDFSDVKVKCINPEILKDQLNKILTGVPQTSLDTPKIHKSAIPVDDSGEIDVNEFIAKITEKPNQILSVNTKMKKSSDESTISVNIGIPALRGLVYDIENKKFYYINTCPGAGSCAVICYARKGSYIQYPEVFVKQTRILNFLLNDPNGFKETLKNELRALATKNKEKKIQFRWNDAGDFFSKKYFQIASEITSELKQEGFDINSYAYTKMGDVVNLKDSNVIINWSNDANKRETSKVNVEGTKRSVIVPKEMFYDLLMPKIDGGRGFERDEIGRPKYKNTKSISILKDRLAKAYNVSKDSIVTYDELLKLPKGKKKYNVIVRPKDGDISAQRNDVLITFLLFH